MSFSKAQTSTMAPDLKPSRNPKCARCRNHGLIVPQKGHVRKCKFVECQCWKCSLITQRTKIMSIQRKIKKSQREEFELACSPDAQTTRPRLNVGEAAPVVDETSRAQEGAPAQTQQTSGVLSLEQGAREVTVIKMPTRRFQEVDGKTYAELEDVPTDIKSATGGAFDPLSNLFDHRRRQPQGQVNHEGCLEYRDETRFSSQVNWNVAPDAPFGVSRNAPRGDFMTAMECGQREGYNGDVLTMPALGLPIRLYARCPSGYAPCPTILVNMPHMPQGAYKEGHGPLMVTPFPPGALHYPPEHGLSYDGRGPFFIPHPPMRPVPYQEELVLRQHPLPPPPKSRDHGAGIAVGLGSQGSEVNSTETDTSSQETL